MCHVASCDRQDARRFGWAGVALLLICAIGAILPHMIRNAALVQYAEGFSTTTGFVSAVAGILAVAVTRAGVPGDWPGLEPAS